MYAAQLKLSPGCGILCTPGDKSMVCQKRPKLSPGYRILWGVVASYVVVLSCVIYGSTVVAWEMGNSSLVYCCYLGRPYCCPLQQREPVSFDGLRHDDRPCPAFLEMLQHMSYYQWRQETEPERLLAGGRQR